MSRDRRMAAFRIPLALGLVLLLACDALTGPPDPPSAPSGLTASAASTSTVELTWSESGGPIGRIEVERAEGGGDFSRIATLDPGVEEYRDESLNAATTYRYRLRACNEGGCSSYSAVATAETLAPLVVETTELPDAVEGEPYEAVLDASGGDGDHTWSLGAGSLPDGLSLSVDGTIHGTPQESGEFGFTVRVTSGDGQEAETELSIVVHPPGGGDGELVIETELLPPGLVDGPYDVGLEASGGDGTSYEWSIVAGSLPDGLGLDSSGRVTGTPTTPETTTVTLEVRSGGSSARAEFEVEVVPNDTGGYNIVDVHVTDVPSGVQDHLDAAIARWEGIVTGDLDAVAIPTDFFGPDHCGGHGEVMNGTSVDDLVLLVEVTSIDGPAGALAVATSPCGTRADTLPVVGLVTLDEADIEAYGSGYTDVLVHELGHVLGFGTLWKAHGFVEGSGTDSPVYTGSEGVARYQRLGGSGDVPLEDDGGQGTAEVHWEEDEFDDELMTGFYEAAGVEQPLSDVTIGAMQDLGYEVDFGAADPFSLAAPRTVAERLEERHRGHDRVHRGPLRILPPDARIPPTGAGR